MNKYHITIGFGGERVDIDEIVDAVTAQVVEPDEGRTFDVVVHHTAGNVVAPVLLHLDDLRVLIAALDRQRNTWAGPADTWPGNNIRAMLAHIHFNLAGGN